MFIKTPMGFQLEFDNGWTASVQFGIGNYCNNRDNRGNPFKDIPEFLQCDNAEIAAWRTDSKGSTSNGWYQFSDGQEVNGWQTTAEVLEFLQLVAKFEGE